MITIKTEQLKFFLAQCASIRLNPHYPALDTIKIFAADDKITFTKTNNNIFCTYAYDQFQPIEESYLIAERQLNGILAVTTSENLKIYQEGNTIFITADGETIMKAPWQDVNLFPLMPETQTDETFLLDTACLNAIRIAAKYISSDAIKTAANFVNIGPLGIFGTNKAIIYHYRKNDLPVFFLDSDTLNILGNIESTRYMVGSKYDFFICDNGVTFAFIKTECVPINYEPYITAPIEHYFILNRQELLNFCTAVEYTTKQELPLASILCNGKMELVYNDADFNDGVTAKIKHEGNFTPPEFRFNVKQVANIMRNITYEKIIFGKLGDHYKLSSVEDDKYTGLIAGMAKVQNQ